MVNVPANHLCLHCKCPSTSFFLLSTALLMQASLFMAVKFIRAVVLSLAQEFPFQLRTRDAHALILVCATGPLADRSYLVLSARQDYGKGTNSLSFGAQSPDVANVLQFRDYTHRYYSKCSVVSVQYLIHFITYSNTLYTVLHRAIPYTFYYT